MTLYCDRAVIFEKLTEAIEDENKENGSSIFTIHLIQELDEIEELQRFCNELSVPDFTLYTSTSASH